MPNGYEKEWRRVEYLQGIRDQEIDRLRSLGLFSSSKSIEPRPIVRESIYYRAGYKGVGFKFDF
jgi:hypothetical protein